MPFVSPDLLAASDPTLWGTLFTAVSAIALLLVLVLWAKVHAFIALLLASYYVGLMSGMELSDINTSIKNGMGGILGMVATVVGLGAIFGKLLEVGGGAQALAASMLKRFGDRRASWAMVVTGFLVSIPVFLDVALVILVPIVYALTKKTGRPVLYFAIPLLAGMAVTHAFVPPTPGPILVAEQLGANLGLVILYGVIIGFPAAILAGPIFGSFISKKITKGVPAEVLSDELAEIDDSRLPSFTRVFLIILLPILLILAQAITQEFYKQEVSRVVITEPGQVTELNGRSSLLVIRPVGTEFEILFKNHVGDEFSINTTDVRGKRKERAKLTALILESSEANLAPNQQAAILAQTLELTGWTEAKPPVPWSVKLISFLGHPFTALIFAIFAAGFFLTRQQGFSREQIMDLCNRALAPAGIIILVTGAGGVFKQILIDSEVATILAETVVQSKINIIVLAFLISSLVRVAQGSATVAMVTTAAIVSPLLPQMTDLSSSDYALITISIAAGATILSHVNDSGFWLVSKFFGLTEKETLMSWTVVETIIALVGFAGALLLSFVV